MVKDLPFAAAYLGDTFDLAQTNQPEGMDFALQNTALEDGLEKTHTSEHLSANT